jgi:hypothetical protein
MEFKVYFELYDRKMSTKVIADSEAAAKQKIKDKIIFHKVVKEETNTDLDELLNFLGLK